MGVERYLGPRRSSCGTLVCEYLADNRLNGRMVMTQCLGATGPRRGIESRMLMLINHASSQLSGAAELIGRWL